MRAPDLADLRRTLDGLRGLSDRVHPVAPAPARGTLITRASQVAFLALVSQALAGGVPPSIRELAARLGVTTTAVEDRIRWLRRSGHLERTSGSRTLRLTAIPVLVEEAGAVRVAGWIPRKEE